MNKYFIGAGSYYKPNYLENTDKWMDRPRLSSVKEERRAFIRKKCGGRR